MEAEEKGIEITQETEHEVNYEQWFLTNVLLSEPLVISRSTATAPPPSIYVKERLAVSWELISRALESLSYRIFTYVDVFCDMCTVESAFGRTPGFRLGK